MLNKLNLNLEASQILLMYLGFGPIEFCGLSNVITTAVARNELLVDVI